MRILASILFGAMLASCAHAGGFSALPPSSQNADSAFERDQPPAGVDFKTLYSFQSGSDGANPYAGLTQLDGAFYGTTYGGGDSGGWGTVYKVDTAGSEHVLYRFKANTDGAHPYGQLLALNGVLYGTTYQGGTSGSGTVFKITTAGAEHVLYSFKGGSNDGQYPYCKLVAADGALYGTTYQGGVYPGWGVVFKVNATSGAEQVLYKFKASNDGAHPWAGLIDSNGTFYGTTTQGGTSGSGTVFKVGPAGDEHIVYSFKGGTDGQYPYSPVIANDGELYGATYQGGYGSGWGVVYKVAIATGAEHVLYRFKASNDGAHPQYGGLALLDDVLYGTTYQGGPGGAGTVFSVTMAGVEKTLYGFSGGADGTYPYSGLTLYNGTFYSTTEGGSQTPGTVFSIKP